MYDLGEGYPQAAAWYRKTAEQGDASAQYLR
jgi:TPR repeat protein